MPHWESIPHVVVAACTGVLANAVLLSNPRAPASRFFAAFLLLVSGNFVTQWLSAAFLVPVPGAERGVTTRNPLWEGVGRVLVLGDAAALLYFESIHPRRTLMGRSPIAAGALLLGCAGLAAWTIASERSDRVGLTPLNLASFAYFHGAYLASLALAVRGLVHAEFEATLEDLRPLVAGLLVVVATRVALVGTDLHVVTNPDLPLAVAKRCEGSLRRASTRTRRRGQRMLARRSPSFPRRPEVGLRPHRRARPRRGALRRRGPPRIPRRHAFLSSSVTGPAVTSSTSFPCSVGRVLSE